MSLAKALFTGIATVLFLSVLSCKDNPTGPAPENNTELITSIIGSWIIDSTWAHVTMDTNGVRLTDTVTYNEDGEVGTNNNNIS